MDKGWTSALLDLSPEGLKPGDYSFLVYSGDSGRQFDDDWAGTVCQSLRSLATVSKVLPAPVRIDPHRAIAAGLMSCLSQ
jgi:hypothetical protein